MDTGNLPPIASSYWVIPDSLLAGAYPGNLGDDPTGYKIIRLLKAGITCFVDLTTSQDDLPPYMPFAQGYVDHPLIYQRFPILDKSIPVSRQQMIDILDFLDASLQAQHVIYLHCWGGIGRTGTVVGCWLARHGTMGQSALQTLRQRWQQCTTSAYCTTPETAVQLNYILHWSE